MKATSSICSAVLAAALLFTGAGSQKTQGAMLPGETPGSQKPRFIAVFNIKHFSSQGKLLGTWTTHQRPRRILKDTCLTWLQDHDKQPKTVCGGSIEINESRERLMQIQ